MKATLDISNYNGFVLMCQLDNLLPEEIDNVITLHADNGFMLNIPRDIISTENRDEDSDYYELEDGTEITIEYLD